MKTVINFKADKKEKEAAQKLASQIGIPLSLVFNASLKNFLRTREVYFSDIPQMSSKLEESLVKIEEDIKNKKNLSHAVTNKDELEKFLATI